jgi:hypothetical protein
MSPYLPCPEKIPSKIVEQDVHFCKQNNLRGARMAQTGNRERKERSLWHSAEAIPLLFIVAYEVAE